MEKCKTVALLVLTFLPFIPVRAETRAEVSGLVSPDSNVRRQTAKQIADEVVARPEAIPLLRKCLSDADVRVRQQALMTIVQQGAFPEHIQDYIELLNDPDILVVTTAVAAIGQLGPSGAQAIEPLNRLFEKVRNRQLGIGESAGLTLAITQALQSIGTPESYKAAEVVQQKGVEVVDDRLAQLAPTDEATKKKWEQLYPSMTPSKRWIWGLSLGFIAFIVLLFIWLLKPS